MNCPVCNCAELPEIEADRDVECPLCFSLIRKEKQDFYALDDGKKPLGRRLFELKPQII